MPQPTASSLLRTLRAERGESLRAVAGDLGVAPSHLSRLERGKATGSDELRARAAAYYRVDADILALAEGRVPDDVVGILQKHPELLRRMREDFGEVGGSQLDVDPC